MGSDVEDAFDGLGDIGTTIWKTATGEYARDAAKVQKESTAVSSASEQVASRTQTRQQVREDRIRRAQLAQQAENTGAGGSSGLAGTAAALSTNLAVNQAYTAGSAATANNLTSLNQQATDLNLQQQLGNQYIELAKTAASAGSA